MGVLVYTFTAGGLSSFTQGFTGLMSGTGHAVAEQFVVEQVALSSFGGGVLAVTLTNSQTSATPASFQQMVSWDPATYTTYEATNLGNIRFCTTNSCSTELYSWLESCSSTCSTGGSTSTSATAWVNLGSNTIAANGGTLTIYMVFGPTSTNFDGVYWGEAPQLSGTYAQYDNGANVFTDYWNFAGTTCPASWTCSGTTINNGLSAPSAASYAYTTATFGLTANILDFYGDIPAATSVNNAGIGYDHDSINGNGPTAMWTINDNTGGAGCASTNACLQTGQSSTVYSYLTTFTTTGTQVYGIYWGSTASVTGYYGYTHSATSTTDVPTAALSIGIYNAQGAQATLGPFNWMRVRDYPPGGVMPSTSLGSASINSGASVYVRNVGTTSSTLVSVFVVDQSTGAFVAQVPISIPVGSGTLVDASYTAYPGLAFAPTPGQTYSFTVTSVLGEQREVQCGVAVIP